MHDKGTETDTSWPPRCFSHLLFGLELKHHPSQASPLRHQISNWSTKQYPAMTSTDVGLYGISFGVVWPPSSHAPGSRCIPISPVHMRQSSRLRHDGWD